MKNLEQLLKDLNENEELRTKFEAAMDAYNGAEKNPDVVKLAIAKEFGYEPDENETAKIQAGEQELSLEDLDDVAGGWCMKNNDCYSVYRNVTKKSILQGVGMAGAVVGFVGASIATGGAVAVLSGGTTLAPLIGGAVTALIGTTGAAVGDIGVKNIERSEKK